MKMDVHITNFQNPLEDALKTSPEKRISSDKRRSSSEPSEFFEFFNDFPVAAAEMSHAEDIIFCGKLVPYKIPKSLSADDAGRFSHRRSPIELLPANKDGKISRRRRLDLVRSDAGDIRRSFSKSSARSEGCSRASKPKWFVLVSGPAKLIRPEMDIRDMKIRRGRRRPRTSMFPDRDAAHSKTTARRKSFWGLDLLRVLSCKSHASVAVGLAPRF